MDGPVLSKDCFFFSVKPNLNHECKQCGKEFDSHGRLNKHVEKRHPVPEEQKLYCAN